MSAQHCDTLLHAGIVLTQNETREVLHNAGIAITAGKIDAVGDWDAISKEFSAKDERDLQNCLVLPGLINCHTHNSMTAFRGLADDLPLMDWLENHIWPMEKKLDAEIIQYAGAIGCGEMIRTGTTCFCDMYLHEDVTAKLAQGTGMRAVLGEGLLGFPTRRYSNLNEALDLIESLHLRNKKYGTRVTTCVAPHAVYTTNLELLEKSFALAEELDIPWTVHLAETTEESARSEEMFGCRPVEYLHRAGCLSPRSVLVHCVDLTEEEQDCIAESGASVVHNPRSNMKLASGISPVAGLLERGVNVCLGTDGAASNNGLNIFREMKAAALLQKVSTQDPTVCPAQTVLDMATRNAAKALGQADLGSIAPKNIADIIALDLDEPALCPVYTPASHIVYAAGGQEVCFSMVAGEVIYSNGVYTHFEIEELRECSRRIADWVRAEKVRSQTGA